MTPLGRCSYQLDVSYMPNAVYVDPKCKRAIMLCWKETSYFSERLGQYFCDEHHRRSDA